MCLDFQTRAFPFSPGAWKHYLMDTGMGGGLEASPLRSNNGSLFPSCSVKNWLGSGGGKTVTGLFSFSSIFLFNFWHLLLFTQIVVWTSALGQHYLDTLSLIYKQFVDVLWRMQWMPGTQSSCQAQEESNSLSMVWLLPTPCPCVEHFFIMGGPGHRGNLWKLWILSLR